MWSSWANGVWGIFIIMEVYRLSKTNYAADLNGTGAKLYGGRWNAVGTPCIYTAASRALAVLEFTVNVTIDFMPKNLSFCSFEIDEDFIQKVTLADLPADWKATPSPLSTKQLGTTLLKNGAPILKLPSVVIPDEFNYILNPLCDKTCFELVAVKEFVLDQRIINS